MHDINLFPYLIIGVGFTIALYFIFRKKKMRSKSLKKRDKQILKDNVGFYQSLNEQNKLKFEDKVAEFLGVVKIEGVGVEIKALDRLLIAASAVIPIFGFQKWRYKNLSTVVLYPNTFNKDFEFEGGERDIGGMVGTGFMNGQMILSQTALHQGFSKSAGKENTGIHEFVHLLDKSDGAMDGIPENLLDKQYVMPWLKMIHEELIAIENDKSDINPYALANEAEFFAVVAEYFFEQPDNLKDKHPQLYAMLSAVFEQKIAS